MATITTPEPGIVALQGEIDLQQSPRVKEVILQLIAQKTKRVLVDLSGVTYIDSSGLALFIEAMQRVHAYGGLFGVYGLRPGVRTIFEIARLDQVFKIYADHATATA